jgi:hypothetical protein
VVPVHEVAPVDRHRTLGQAMPLRCHASPHAHAREISVAGWQPGDPPPCAKSASAKRQCR